MLKKSTVCSSWKLWNAQEETKGRKDFLGYFEGPIDKDNAKRKRKQKTRVSL